MILNMNICLAGLFTLNLYLFDYLLLPPVVVKAEIIWGTFKSGGYYSDTTRLCIFDVAASLVMKQYHLSSLLEYCLPPRSDAQRRSFEQEDQVRLVPPNLSHSSKF